MKIHAAMPLDAQAYLTDTDCDAHVRSVQPYTTFGLDEVLEISRNETDFGTQESIVFIKQDLSGLQPDDIILFASLSISWKEMWDIPQIVKKDLLIGAYWCSDNGWTEETITWNNAPWAAVSSQPIDVDSGDSHSSRHQFDITAAIQNSLALQEVTIVLRAEENGVQYFWSYHGLPAPGMMAHLYVLYVPASATDAIDINAEYSSGFLPELSLWYTCINTGFTHLFFIVAVYPEYNYYFPSVNFVGQHFFGKDGTELVVGHTLLLYELFNDTNQNGYLDANFTKGEFETSYYLAFNISTGFTPQPVQKRIDNETWHYVWGVHYSNVMGFLIYSNGSAQLGGDTAAILTLDYLETSYDYYLQENATYLKTNLAIGSVTDFNPILPSATLNGFSLAALYSTLLLTTSPETSIVIESGEYNSSLAKKPSLPTNTANILGTNLNFYNFLFNESYTLYSPHPENYLTKTSACPSTSLHPHVPKKQFDFPLNIFQGFSLAFLPRIANSSMPIDFDYRHSGLLYRVNYPHWDGYALIHDPTYIANFGGLPPLLPPTTPTSPTTPTTLTTPPPYWVPTLIVVTFSGILVIVIISLSIRHLRKAREV